MKDGRTDERIGGRETRETTNRGLMCENIVKTVKFIMACVGRGAGEEEERQEQSAYSQGGKEADDHPCITKRVILYY